MNIKSLSFCLIGFLIGISVWGQDAPMLFGKVIDEKGNPLEFANVAIEGTSTGATTNENGYYEITGLQANKTLRVIFRYTGYESMTQTVNLKQGQKKRLNATLQSKTETMGEVVVKGDLNVKEGVRKIDPKLFSEIPGLSELAIIKTLQGVASNSELSSQYSVRGGNYDENLIYVNDFEIYKPFLIRTGQQEGLNFINPDMIQTLSFSPGGFAAKYGDKLSSVLDIKYKKQHASQAKLSLSLLGASVHVAGGGLNERLTYNVGIRNRTNRYLFNALPVEGEYSPSASDVQAFFTYDLTTNLQWQYLVNYARNSFLFRPTVSQTSFGTFNQSLQLDVYFEGQENDAYRTLMNGTALSYFTDDKKLNLKLMASAYNTREQEAFDIIGEYWIGEVEKNFGSENFGERKRTLGVGTYHDWARNELKANIFNVEHKGYLDKGEHFLSWGVKFQHEEIDDKINEWYRVDSAGYSKPIDDQEVLLRDVLKTKINLSSNRYYAYLQDSWNVADSNRLVINYGVRANYWDLNKELIITPRVLLSYVPRFNDKETWRRKELSFRLAVGAYYQPPFYRELRNFDGEINRDLKAQKSLHTVVGMDYTFPLWNRPFKFTSEAYYKYLWDLVSYDIDNVLIRYSALNNATGYATGIDMRINGEFVEGVESWFSLSVMQTKENLDNDFYYLPKNAAGETVIAGVTEDQIVVDSLLVEPGLIFRPTDQRINFSIFFQDHLPGNENFKVHLNFLYGTGMSFSPPDKPRYRNKFRLPAYRRVDIGFSALLFDREKKELRPTSAFRVFKKIWASVEIFNLLGVSNTISYTWVDDFTGRTYGVPNYLTSRRLNAKIHFDF